MAYGSKHSINLPSFIHTQNKIAIIGLCQTIGYTHTQSLQLNKICHYTHFLRTVLDATVASVDALNIDSTMRTCTFLRRLPNKGRRSSPKCFYIKLLPFAVNYFLNNHFYIPFMDINTIQGHCIQRIEHWGKKQYTSRQTPKV